jgi:hypothetical protein
MMQPTNPNPTVSMTFILGLLLLMSIFSLFAPQTEVSSQGDDSELLNVTYVESYRAH